MTNGFRKFTAVLMLIPLWLSAAGGPSRAEDPGQDEELSLADLTAYRAALSGKATADSARPSDPAARVGFRDLWKRSDAHRGRRVTVEGRVERIFRQGPVGSFPPLIQVWAYSPAGDPFCLVFPRPTDPTTPGQAPEPRTASQPVNRHQDQTHTMPTAIPRLGQTVHFTGTFLKMVRYAAGDGPRLAPLIVGDGPPEPAAGQSTAHMTDDRGSPSSSAQVLRAIGGAGASASGPDQWAWSPISWGLGMALAGVAAGILAWQHLRGAQLRVRSALRNRRLDPESADTPLSFIDMGDGPSGRTP
jgi:hypothetical protein